MKGVCMGVCVCVESGCGARGVWQGGTRALRNPPVSCPTREARVLASTASPGPAVYAGATQAIVPPPSGWRGPVVLAEGVVFAA